MDYPPLIRELWNETLHPPLGPGRGEDSVRLRLSELSLDTLFAPRKIQDSDMARCCLAGLWLLHDFLDESHNLSQDIGSPEGSYWHGLMHRREPDFWNSKYWFRRVGRHPVFEPLTEAARGLASVASLPSAASFLRNQKTWDPFAFVDLCEAAYNGKVDCKDMCCHIQKREYELLFEHCFHRAVGGNQ